MNTYWIKNEDGSDPVQPETNFALTNNGFYIVADLLIKCNQLNIIKHTPKHHPVLFASGENDPVGQKMAGVWQVAKNFQKQNISQTTVLSYPGQSHELLMDDKRETVMLDAYQWLKRQQLIRKG